LGLSETLTLGFEGVTLTVLVLRVATAVSEILAVLEIFFATSLGAMAFTGFAGFLEVAVLGVLFIGERFVAIGVPFLTANLRPIFSVVELFFVTISTYCR
jgi:hypothetical protein